jgi:lipid-binding SYLF domain-containing protein
MRLTRRGTARLLAGACAVAFVVQPIAALADARRQALVDDALAAAKKVVESSDFPDAPRMLKEARAVLIVPNMVQGGFIIGAAGGRGVLLTRAGAGDWSYPAFYGMGSGSIGLQIGAKVSEVIFIIRSEKGLQAILDSRYKFGAEAGLTVATIGGGAAGATTAAAGADIVAFSKATGLFAGAALEGSYLDPDNDWNQLYYGMGAKTRTIVMDRRYTNRGADPLRQYLAKF